MRKARGQSLQGEAETAYLIMIGEELGLGEAVREFKFAKSIKRNFAADLAWPQHKLLLEIEGGIYSRGRHTRGAGYEKDCEKYSLASILGFTLIRVSYGMIREGMAYKLLLMAAQNKVKEKKNV